MDEPFSALDVLTAQNLRAELLRLWTQSDFPTKAMLIVTHNIEEAVVLADRIFVLGANPGRIRSVMPVQFPQPRDRHEPTFQALVDEIYGFMTGGDSRAPSHVWTVATPGEGSPVDTPLPAATVGGMAGLLEILARDGGREDLAELAHDLTFEVDDLLPLVDAAQLLGLAGVEDADLQITDDGEVFVAADIHESTGFFARRAHERPSRPVHLQRLDDDQGREPGRELLLGSSAPRLLRGGGPRADPHRGRLGALRRAVRFRRPYGPACPRPFPPRGGGRSVSTVRR